MFKKFKEFITNNEEMADSSQKFLSLFFLFICGLMSFFTYTHRWLGGLWNTEFTFKPGFISSLIAIFLITPLYLRNILKWNKSIYSIISLICILLVVSSFVELIMGGNEKGIIIQASLSVALALSWLGLRSIAGGSWLIVFITAIYSAIVNNLAMGFQGFIYVCFGFLGLVLHSGLNPGMLINGIREEFSRDFNDNLKIIKEDINSTGNVINKSW